MATTLEIVVAGSASDTRYPIHIGTDLLRRLGERLPLAAYSSVAVVSDTQVGPLWLPPLLEGLPAGTEACLLPPGESHKTIDAVQRIWDHLHHQGCDRRSLLLNLGGGVIGDLGGFAASTYMRGIDFVQIPTTLLSQVDASVGGKVGCNLRGIKNLVGAFQQPVAVFVDLDTLSTLDDAHQRAGWAEIIKHAAIADRDTLATIRACQGNPRPPAATLSAIVERSCRIKARIIEQDEREGGLRKILNFGHTVGHALESLQLDTDTPLLHGEAVALGMVAEAEISRALGWISEPDVGLLEDTLRGFGLPVRLPQPLPWTSLRPLLLADKKNVQGTIRWTLLSALGRATFDQSVDEATVQRSLQRLWTPSNP